MIRQNCDPRDEDTAGYEVDEPPEDVECAFRETVKWSAARMPHSLKHFVLTS